MNAGGSVNAAGATGNARAWLLAIDTATSLVVIAAGTLTGEVIASRSAAAEHRHGERLLAMIDGLVEETGLELAALSGVIVGTGPGAFTGLRVGLATAKALAHELGVAIAGISTGEALLSAGTAAGIGGENVVLRLPAGPHDRVEIRPGQPPRWLPGGAAEHAPAESETAIAVDLTGRASEADLERGAAAIAGLPASLLQLGVDRLRGGGDDAATLVPEYVMLPRGVGPGLDVGEGMSWSRDRP
jgi:tRNA threonylcarbamoyl adenosine modification protein YeaZ